MIFNAMILKLCFNMRHLNVDKSDKKGYKKVTFFLKLHSAGLLRRIASSQWREEAKKLTKVDKTRQILRAKAIRFLRRGPLLQ